MIPYLSKPRDISHQEIEEICSLLENSIQELKSFSSSLRQETDSQANPRLPTQSGVNSMDLGGVR